MTFLAPRSTIRWMLAALAFVGASSLWSIPVYGQTAGAADPPRLVLPLDCRPGVDCWIVNHVDLDPGPETRDYACGGATYDGHKGTDFAIRDLAAMRGGVPVRAAADGIVVGARDGVEDVGLRGLTGGGAEISRRECGNGICVQHEGGWFTQYCHLRKGSIAVKRGDRIAAGQSVGFVGLSGKTEFPHVHLQVDRNGQIIDPFVGEKRAAACGPGESPLWAPDVLAKLAYSPTAIYIAGFSSETPNDDKARNGDYATVALDRNSPMLGFWADIFWPRPGDIVRLAVFAPGERKLFEQTRRVSQPLVRQFQFGAARRPAAQWTPGAYRGEVVVHREQGAQGPQEFRMTRQIVID